MSKRFPDTKKGQQNLVRQLRDDIARLEQLPPDDVDSVGRTVRQKLRDRHEQARAEAALATTAD